MKATVTWRPESSDSNTTPSMRRGQVAAAGLPSEYAEKLLVAA